MTERLLFGGAISCLIPSSWRDVSSVREVPDHQECWQDTTDGRLLVVEILEQQDVSDEQSAEFFYNDLADYNNCAAGSFQTMTYPDAHCHRSNMNYFFGCGLQTVSRDVDNRGASPELHDVWIELCVIRLPTHGTDILLSLSTPIDPTSKENLSSADASVLFKNIMSSFHIKDWTLFN